MTRSDCDTEMLAGYWDGLNGESEPGSNRSHSYRHGWKNGRDDRNKSPRSAASYIREEADKARELDLAA
jgi:hypothetical protein